MRKNTKYGREGSINTEQNTESYLNYPVGKWLNKYVVM